MYLAPGEFNHNLIPCDFLRDNYGSDKITDSSPKYPAWNMLYYSVVGSLRRKQDNIIVETGTRRGCQTLLIAQAMKDMKFNGKIYTMEAQQEFVEDARKHAEKADLSKYIEFLVGDTRKDLADVVKKLDHINFACLDAGHLCGEVENEIEIVKDKVKKVNGCMYFDNVMKAGVREALDNFKNANPKGNLLVFPNLSYAPEGQAIWKFETFREINEDLCSS